MTGPELHTLSPGTASLSACITCGGTTFRDMPDCTAMVRSAFEGSRVARCLSCGLVQMRPRPQSLDGVYEDDYFEAYNRAGLLFPTGTDALHPRYAARLARAARMAGRGRVLEVGVGHGAFLALARRLGWDTLGVDVSGFVARHVQRTYGITVFCGDLGDADIAASSIDFVHLSHVLEHLPDPVATLRQVARVLKPGGVLAIEVPNELENLYVLARRWTGSTAAYPVRCTHLTFFTPRTVAATVARAGFDVVRSETIRDTTAGSRARRVVKRAASLIERPFGLAPLIELFAIRSRRAC